MTKHEEFVARNIELSAEFSHYLFEHPELESQIPADAELILLPEFDPQLKKNNAALGRQIEAEGGKAFYVSIGNLRPKSYSRIEGIELARSAVVAEGREGYGDGRKL